MSISLENRLSAFGAGRVTSADSLTFAQCMRALNEIEKLIGPNEPRLFISERLIEGTGRPEALWVFADGDRAFSIALTTEGEDAPFTEYKPSRDFPSFKVTTNEGGADTEKSALMREMGQQRLAVKANDAIEWRASGENCARLDAVVAYLRGTAKIGNA